MGSCREISGPLRVVVAHDNVLFREGLASLLSAAGHEVVARAADAGDLLLKVRSYVPDVAIVYGGALIGPADDRALVTADIRRAHPMVSILVLSEFLEPARVLELVGGDAAGVGYLVRDRVRDVAELLGAVERVAAGGTVLDSRALYALVRGQRESVLDKLNKREREVLALIAEGRSNRAIAGQLYLSLRAIERHVQAIFRTLLLPDSEDDNRRVLAALALLGHSPAPADDPRAIGRLASRRLAVVPLPPRCGGGERFRIELDLEQAEKAHDLLARRAQEAAVPTVRPPLAGIAP